MSQLDKQFTALDIIVARHEGWKDGFKAYKQLVCDHPTEEVESQFNEDEQYAFCTRCEKNLTQKVLDETPEYIDDPERDEVPF